MNKALKNNVALLGTTLFAVMMVLSSCTKNDLNSPGVEYMPDMYRSPSYETYSENGLFEDNSTARTPVAGTMSQGEYPGEGNLLNALPYPYENTVDGYNAAGAELKNPIERTDAVVAEGKDIYIKMCMHCHGKGGKGDGQLIETGKFPPPPSYSGPLRELVEGKMFHSITYGKNLMGAHASQLTKEDRWKVVHYIQDLQKL